MHELLAHQYSYAHQLKSHLGQVAATQIYGTVEYVQSQESLPLRVSQHRLHLPVRTKMLYICSGQICTGNALVWLGGFCYFYYLNDMRPVAMLLDQRALVTDKGN